MLLARATRPLFATFITLCSILSRSMSTGSTTPAPGSMQLLFSRAAHSYLQQLTPDPESAKYAPNKRSRQVLNGHYVPVLPTPLTFPLLLAHSQELAAELGLDDAAVHSNEFLRYLSGDMSVSDSMRSWATPYALSIYGEPQTRNCPFGTGNGYGDGRAHSIGEVVIPHQSGAKRYEFQLKGSGTTPFSRSGDGRAVLRSSLREFVAEEAMFHLGVPTTRGLSLIMSETETVQRPWYSDRNASVVEDIEDDGKGPLTPAIVKRLTVDHPRLAHIPLAKRQSVIDMLREQVEEQSTEPDVMQTEAAAIACRVAPSFIRVGHLDVLSRRYKRDPSDVHRQALQSMIEHTLFREFSDADQPAAELHTRIAILLRESGKRLAALMAHWLRVGFNQGNFNSDNCLVAGRTMDYGPFGFIELYRPDFVMWVGGGRHFAFMNQPNAALKNLGTLASAVLPLVPESHMAEVKAVIDEWPDVMQSAVQQMWASKLGFTSTNDASKELQPELMHNLMRQDRVDYTIVWRQLAVVAENAAKSNDVDKIPADELLQPLLPAFFDYEGMTSQAQQLVQQRWSAWLRRWLRALIDHSQQAPQQALSSAAERMKLQNPKFIPREWMLVEAYKAAEQNNLQPLNTLIDLFKQPYTEQSVELTERFYRRASADDLSKGGTAFMT